MRKTNTDTKLGLIVADEEQGGKSTEIVNKSYQVQEEENNIILTHGQKHIRDDLTKKAAGKLKNICDRYSIKEIQKLYAQGKTPKYNFMELLNHTVLKEIPKLYQNTVPTNCYFDEGDTLAFAEDYIKPDGNLVQKDQLALEMFKQNVFKELWLISATWWDWIWIKQNFDKVINIAPYEGFHGTMEATYIERPEDFWRAIINALKTNSPLPRDFIALVESFPSALIDVGTKLEHHKQLRDVIENAGMMNSLSKDINTHPRLIGGHLNSRSYPYPQNVTFYYRASNDNRHEMHQHLGRVNGRAIPIIVCTPEVKKLRLEDHIFKQLALKDKVLEMPYEERMEWVKDKEILNPRTFTSPKARHNRVYKLNPESYEKGEESKLVEKRHTVWAGGVDLRTLKGNERGLLIEKCFKEQYSHLYDEAKSYKTMMSEDEFRKFRGTKREADYRFGIIPGTNGMRAYIHEQTDKYTEGCSIFSEEGKIIEFTKKPTKRGTIDNVETKNRATA
jgi:hypothetical protein